MGILIRNVHLLDRPGEERTNVYITAGRISGIGKEPKSFSLDETVDGSSKTLMPGLINCHGHSYMSLMRNFADDVPFSVWLFDKVTPIEDSMTPEQAYWGNMLSIMEMIRTGTTTFTDMHMFPRMTVKACADSGMRALVSRGIVGTDRNDEGAIRRFEEAFDEMEYAKSKGSDCMFAIAPHAIYTCGEDLLKYCAEVAAERGLLLNTHLTESEFEFETCLKEHGCTPVQYLHKLGLFEQPILLAHCVNLTEEDYPLLKNPNVHVVTNPASNMKLANGFAPVTRMLKEGIHVCIGTDGPASNNSLNMFREMNLLSMSQKGVAKDAVAMTAEETLQLATVNGADALGRPDLGRIEVGKTADLVLIDETHPNLHPIYNRKAALVYSAYGTEVSDVMIGGKLVFKDGQYTTIDAERVRYEIGKIAAKLR